MWGRKQSLASRARRVFFNGRTRLWLLLPQTLFTGPTLAVILVAKIQTPESARTNRSLTRRALTKQFFFHYRFHHHSKKFSDILHTLVTQVNNNQRWSNSLKQVKLVCNNIQYLQDCPAWDSFHDGGVVVALL